mmetsp:Transcript_15139/g.43213  ORF Transcript_15139/g.43213 Transcript_15139/m.43213 type:complete len:559 (-) Transcript_15139:107-1783(-)
MRICHGLAGYTVEVDDRELEWRKPIDVVRHHASTQWKLDPEDLIVLASGGETLGGTEEFSRGGDVFFFVRSDLDPKADVPADRLLLNPDNSACSASSIHPGVPTEDDDLLGDPAFEVFRGNIAEARRHLAEAKPTAALAAKVRERLEVQRLAARAVLDNLSSQRATCSSSMSKLLQKYERVQERFDQNLGKVEESMAALAEVELHPALQASGRACLADAVPQERILRFTAGVQEERSRLAQRLEKLRQQDTQTQALSEQIGDGLQQALAGESVPAGVRAISQELARAELELLPALRSQVPGEGAAASSILEEEKRSTGILEGLAQACTTGLGRLLSELSAAWEQQCWSFLQRLREVSYIQSQVRNVERQAALLEEEINVQRNYSQQLNHLQKMPKAYRRALCEIARRRQFRARYAAQAEEARSALARMVEEENGRRRDFIHQFGCHLPADLFDPLGSFALPAAVEVPEFDNALPEVDFASLREAVQLPAGGASAGSAGSNEARQQLAGGASASSASLPTGSCDQASATATGAAGGSGASSGGSSGVTSQTREPDARQA